MSISETRSAEGLRSELVIERADRRDSGVYRCQASNPYGRSDHFVHLAVQGKFKKYIIFDKNQIFILLIFGISILFFFSRASRTAGKLQGLRDHVPFSSSPMAQTVRWKFPCTRIRGAIPETRFFEYRLLEGRRYP